MSLFRRTYDPSTGRFLTRDPIFDGRNWYSYGGGEANPLTGADPTGLIRELLKKACEKLGNAIIDWLMRPKPKPAPKHGNTKQTTSRQTMALLQEPWLIRTILKWAKSYSG